MILETEFETADGAVRLVDFMPPNDHATDLVRIVEACGGGCGGVAAHFFTALARAKIGIG